MKAISATERAHMRRMICLDVIGINRVMDALDDAYAEIKMLTEGLTIVYFKGAADAREHSREKIATLECTIDAMEHVREAARYALAAYGNVPNATYRAIMHDLRQSLRALGDEI